MNIPVEKQSMRNVQKETQIWHILKYWAPLVIKEMLIKTPTRLSTSGYQKLFKIVIILLSRVKLSFLNNEVTNWYKISREKLALCYRALKMFIPLTWNPHSFFFFLRFCILLFHWHYNRSILYCKYFVDSFNGYMIFCSIIKL